MPRGPSGGATPVPAAGLRVAAFASGLDHPRWLLVLPNGDVLVAESNAPPKPAGSTGVMDWIAGQVMKRAGAGVPSANRITLLRDADGDGVAELQTPLLEGLRQPFGMALVGDQFYVGNTDGVVVFPYTPGSTRITAPGRQLCKFRSNGHWTRSLLLSPDGSKLVYTTNLGGRYHVIVHEIATKKEKTITKAMLNPSLKEKTALQKPCRIHPREKEGAL